jgi:hypothetical protein
MRPHRFSFVVESSEACRLARPRGGAKARLLAAQSLRQFVLGCNDPHFAAEASRIGKRPSVAGYPG